jgi:transcriptional antiterminator RfaH
MSVDYQLLAGWTILPCFYAAFLNPVRVFTMERSSIAQRSQEENVKPAWYCLRSQPKHEHIAAAHLRILEGVTVFCPRIRFKKVTRQGSVWVTEAMFPGYLFAHFTLTEMHRQVQYAPGVSGIVRFADRYPTIDEVALDHLRVHTGESEVRELSYKLSQGDEVRILEGAFAGLEAVVVRVLPAKERVKILMDFLGRKIEAEVGHSSVLRYVLHPLAA